MNFTKILWIELLGFDNAQKDFGVAEFLSRMPVKPEAISILLWNTEIIHAHSDLTEDAPLGSWQCAYCGRPYNEERNRQDWTKFQLKGLVDELHKCRIKVYPSVFDQVLSDNTAKKHGFSKPRFWLDDHQEVLYTLADGTTAGSICPWKRLKDGSFYEDFFLAQLEKLITDYGFDGFHIADGYAHPRFPLCQGDFSADMIEQFQCCTKTEVHGEDLQQRASWINQYAMDKWIQFHAQRHNSLWKKCFRMLARLGKDHIFNSAWTRDPFEAKLRYGVDYVGLAEAGLKNIIVEAPAAVLELEGWNKSPIHTLDQYLVTIARIKAAVPQCRLIILNGVKDGMEQYSALRHAPARLEAEIVTMANVFHNNKRCLDGVLTCLADGIKKREWEFLDETYQLAFSSEPAQVPGPVVLWSNEAVRNELTAYCKRNVMNSCRLQQHLQTLGIFTCNMAEPNPRIMANRPCIILNPASWPKDVRKQLRNNYKLYEIGQDDDGRFAYSIWEDGKPRGGWNIRIKPQEKIKVTSWLDELKEDALHANTWKEDLFTEIQEEGFVRAYTGNARAWCFESQNAVRIFVFNTTQIYRVETFSIFGLYSTSKIISDYPPQPVTLTQEDHRTVFTAKLPPSGIVIIDLLK